MRALDRPYDALMRFEEALEVVPYHASALAERAKSGVMFAFRRALAVCTDADEAEAKVRVFYMLWLLNIAPWSKNKI